MWSASSRLLVASAFLLVGTVDALKAQNCTAASNPIVCSSANGVLSVTGIGTATPSYPSTIAIPVGSPAITKVVVTLNNFSNATFPNGPDILLESPNGTKLNIFGEPCDGDVGVSNKT